MNKSSYARAGVDIDAKMAGLSSVKGMIRKTAVKGVLSEIGAFGGFFASPGPEKVLVASTDGVGTKLKVAVMAGRHDTVGQDIVNHCVNDILVHGAFPLFFMDYVGASRFKGDMFKQIISGLCKACRENHCALLGGETAEMPGLYPGHEYDLVGTIVGSVDRKRIITGRHIRPGDIVIGLPSTGLHTNGYSLARKVILETAGLGVNEILPGTGRTVAECLLAVHRSYLEYVRPLLDKVQVRGMAHITGGGFPDNIARVMPSGTCAVIDRSSWRVPRLFAFIQAAGNVDREEMYRVFNMGTGMVIIVREEDADTAIRVLKKTGIAARVVGRVKKGNKPVEMIA